MQLTAHDRLHELQTAQGKQWSIATCNDNVGCAQSTNRLVLAHISSICRWGQHAILRWTQRSTQQTTQSSHA